MPALRVMCCLQPVFNFSSASHSLLSVFRALSGAHGAAIAAKSKEAVAEQLALLLPQAQQLGAVCVPTLPADVRDPYAKQVLVVQGLVALTSAVARNVTAMLQQVRGLASLVQCGCMFAGAAEIFWVCEIVCIVIQLAEDACMDFLGCIECGVTGLGAVAALAWYCTEAV
jgi:hypothetical protein